MQRFQLPEHDATGISVQMQRDEVLAMADWLTGRGANVIVTWQEFAGWLFGQVKAMVSRRGAGNGWLWLGGRPNSMHASV